MILNVKVYTNKNQSKLEFDSEQKILKVFTTKTPINNKANDDVIDIISKGFRIPKNKIQIIRGATSNIKTLSIQSDQDLMNFLK